MGQAGKEKHMSMACSLNNNCAKNVCKQTVLVQLIIEDAVSRFLETVYIQHWNDICSEHQPKYRKAHELLQNTLCSVQNGPHIKLTMYDTHPVSTILRAAGPGFSITSPPVTGQSYKKMIHNNPITCVIQRHCVLKLDYSNNTCLNEQQNMVGSN